MFKKISTIGLSEPKLDPRYWAEIKKRGNEFGEGNDADAILIDVASPFTKKEIDKYPDLRFVDVFGTGYGKIDVDYAASKGITVSNIPGPITQSVAEFTFAAILEVLREIERAKRQAREGNYSESGFIATEIKGKNFGIIGLGRIGRRVGEIAKGFGAKVHYYSRNEKPDSGFMPQSLSDLVKTSDFISLNLALNSETRGIINGQIISEIKDGAIVINTSPMELIDLTALVKRLNKITFILDHSDEMKTEDLKLLSQFPNCIIYPPVGYISIEARNAKQEILIQNMDAFLKGKPQNKVN